MANTDTPPASNALRSLIIICIFIMLTIVGGVAAYLSLQVEGPTDFVILKADPAPLRIKPEEVGGKQIDHQETAVLQMLDDIKTPDNNAERLVLPDANPELPPVPLPDPEPEEAPETEGNIGTGTLAEAGVDTQPSAASETKQPETEQPLAETKEPAISPTPTPRPAPKLKEPLTPVATEQASNTPKIITEPAEIDAENPPLMVQLAAFREQVKAEQAAALLSEKHKARLLSLQLGIMSVDTGSSGIFWRVITEPLPATDARNICTALKSAGQDCILRKITTGQP